MGKCGKIFSKDLAPIKKIATLTFPLWQPFIRLLHTFPVILGYVNLKYKQKTNG